ncbi:fatty acid cis/trans isomerase [Thiocapsa roseopersicina]|uniref:Fatty acid cis/trans isomerase (CTI) n=1 Tax=Thiocapsa roseopersicina TaxID=1058 RepID=A0A1H2SYZ9_THIRO|nr:fatty acid cis/trans isomerase [Thiocapsa roseopersicina]SDW36822.1 Fatty acid cis/trans isomerase (CTI) [Thiocapsa roseopersicina]
MHLDARGRTTIRRWPAAIAILLAAFILAGPLRAAAPQDTARASIADGSAEFVAAETPNYGSQVQPIFDRRCIACHGCLGSPCNVKLDSYRGVDRGGFGENPYSTRLTADPRTDMDAAQTTAEWRERGFYPILARTESAQTNLDDSILFRMIEAGMRNNGPGFSRASVDPFRLQRFAATCPSTAEALAARLQEHPGLGMPFGLPALAEEDFAILRDWIALGSPGPTEAEEARAQEVGNPTAVAAWEAFFNGSDPRQALVSRFIFEHVFLATIVLEDSPGDRFRLVRSRTPPPQVVEDGQGGRRVESTPIDLISTALPYGDPGTERFWYRLEKLTAAPVQKSFFVWRLAPDDIARLSDLFLSPDWAADADLDPPWDIGNPFRVFAAIPAEARYRFLLENAEVIIGGITYGPVCNGQIATYAVKDQFWVFFLDPEHDVSVRDPSLGLDGWDLFMDRSLVGNAEYLEAYAKTRARLDPDGWSLDAIWDGDGENRNAWLTILRHETNVSVLRGAQGGMPQTFWLMGYSGLERLYYDTVASFEYWAGDGRKLETLLFFNMLRQEFEDGFLGLLPRQERERIRHQWTRGIGSVALSLIPFETADQPTRVDIRGPDPLLDLVEQIAQRLGPRISGLPDRLNPRVKPERAVDAPVKDFDDWEVAVSMLTAVQGQRFVPEMPSVLVLRLNRAEGPPQDRHRVYSLVANRVYKSQYTLMFQNGQALPDEDTLSLYPTLVNGFPNLFIDLDLADASRFLTDLRAIQGKDDWNRFASRYGILRDSTRFWPFYDWINRWNVENRGDAAGWLDLSYYDAPET